MISRRFTWPLLVGLSLVLAAKPGYTQGAPQTLPSSPHMVNPAQYGNYRGSVFAVSKSTKTSQDSRQVGSRYILPANQKIYELPMLLHQSTQTASQREDQFLLVKAADWPLLLGVAHFEERQNSSIFTTDYRQVVNTDDEIEDQYTQSAAYPSLVSRGGRVLGIYSAGLLAVGTEVAIADHVAYGDPSYRTLDLKFGASAFLNNIDLGLAYQPKVDLVIENRVPYETPPSLMYHLRYLLLDAFAFGIVWEQVFASATASTLADHNDVTLHGAWQLAGFSWELDYLLAKNQTMILVDQKGSRQLKRLAMRFNYDFGGLLVHLAWQKETITYSSNEAAAGSGQSTIWGAGLTLMRR